MMATRSPAVLLALLAITATAYTVPASGGGKAATSTFIFASADQATTSKGCQIEGAYPTYVRTGVPHQQTSATLVLKLTPSSTITGSWLETPPAPARAPVLPVDGIPSLSEVASSRSHSDNVNRAVQESALPTST